MSSASVLSQAAPNAPWSIDTAMVSVFADTYHTKPKETASIRQWITILRSDRYAKQCQALRAAYPSANTGEADYASQKAAYADRKKALPQITPCGTFSQRNNASLQQHNGTVHGDVDDLSCEEAVALRTRLARDPHIVYGFLSPGGHGVKLGVRIDQIVPDNATYKHCWEIVQQYCQTQHTTALDASANDIARGCFVSYDPAAYLAEEVWPLVIPPLAPRQKAAFPSFPTDAPCREEVESALMTIAAYDDRACWLKVGMALHSTGESWARALWDKWSQQSDKYEERTQGYQWEQSFQGDKGVTIRTLFALARAEGWEGLSTGGRAPRQQRPWTARSSVSQQIWTRHAAQGSPIWH